MVSGARYCPLCRSPMPADRCLQHDVPTVRIDRDPEPVSVGSIVEERFRIEASLGPNVFLATEIERRAPVVLKVPRSGAADREVAWGRFFQEARALLAIDDPHVVSARALLLERSSERVYLVLEHLPNGTLEQRLDSGPLEISRAVSIACDVASGLIALHARGVVHRDLKPSNVAFDADDRAVLIDVGHAKLGEAEAAPPLTAPGQTLGTPAYMAPEGIAGGTLDPRADLYALGCLVFAMVCGEPPFGRGDPVEVMRRHLRQAPADLPATVPAELRALVMHLLAKSKLERPESAAEVLARLKAVPTHGVSRVAAPVIATQVGETDYTAVLPQPLDAPAGVTVTTPADEPARTRRPRVSIGGVVAIGIVLALLAVVARLWFERERPRPLVEPITSGPRASATDHPTAQPLPTAVSNTRADGGVRRRLVRTAPPRAAQTVDAGVRPLLRIPELDP